MVRNTSIRRVRKEFFRTTLQSTLTKLDQNKRFLNLNLSSFRWVNNRGGHSIFFSLFAIDGSITFSLLIDFDKSTFLGIFMFASSINRCFRQVTKNPFLLSEEVIYESQTDSSGAWGGGRGEGGGGCNPIQQLIA
jgi:hypothetical protein